jgi:hypothetical protein
MVLLEIHTQRVDQRRLLWIQFLRAVLGFEGQQGPKEVYIWKVISRDLLGGMSCGERTPASYSNPADNLPDVDLFRPLLSLKSEHSSQEQ